MPLTREFKQTIMADLKDREYRAAYLAQAIEAMHGGEFSVGKRMLRNYINATIGFEALSKAVGSPAKSLMRMLGESSNPHADKLFGILKHLQETDGLEVRVVPKAKRAQGSLRSVSAMIRSSR
jgi:DNA-binding phage protein